MSLNPDERLHEAFRTRIATGDLPPAPAGLSQDISGVAPSDLIGIFESQLMSRHTDFLARRLGRQKRGFYSIGSAGHEGNAALAHVLRTTDMAFLHYRSGAFLIERQRKVPGTTPLWDMVLSLVASREDPVSGGRHKVLGSLPLLIPPQTSTIASHLPKALGAAFSIALARTQRKTDSVMPHDAVAIASFGDASANHSTAVGAINAAAHTAFRGLPLPLIFLCEDNGIGISVPTPSGWIGSTYQGRAGLEYVSGDGTELLDALRASADAERLARQLRRPVFLHLSTVRLMGHAGSDQEAGYRSAEEIRTSESRDPLLRSARTLIDAGLMSAEDILALDATLHAQLDRMAEDAVQRPRLTTAAEVMAPIIPLRGQGPARLVAPPEARAAAMAGEERALEQPQHMSRLISLALADLMAADPSVIVFGEDVGRKGGVYGATTRLQPKFGPTRIFDTLLDEQTILGLAIGAAQNGFLPIPEIQFLAYVHNAEDQIRGEAATLPFFSDGRATNPMVIRVQGLAYQRGFGGHFHNDNGLAVFRDIPGLILATPSHGADAVRLLRECYRLAKAEGRVVIFLEPIALYGTKDLHTDGDGLMSFAYPPPSETLAFGAVGVEGTGTDIAIISYANGAYLSRRAMARLATKGVSARLIDLRWLKPLPIDAVIDASLECGRLLIVDECRRTGAPSEELITGLVERGVMKPMHRLAAEDSFVPLGPAANTVLVGEDDIFRAALGLLGREQEAAA